MHKFFVIVSWDATLTSGFVLRDSWGVILKNYELGISIFYITSSW